MSEDHAPLRTSPAVHEADEAEVETVAAAPASWKLAAAAGAAGGAAVDIAIRLIGG